MMHYYSRQANLFPFQDTRVNFGVVLGQCQQKFHQSRCLLMKMFRFQQGSIIGEFFQYGF